MGMIEHKHPWLIQPQGYVRLKSEYADRLVLATHYGNGVAVDLKGLTAAGVGGQYVVDRRGRGWMTTTGGSQYMGWGNPATMQFSETSDWTMLSLFMVGGGESQLRMILAKDSGNSPRPLFHFRLDSDNLHAVWGHTSYTLGSVTGTQKIGLATRYGETHCAAFRRKAGVSATLFLDGQVDGSGSDASTGTWTVSTGTVRSQYEGSTSDPWNGVKYLDLVFPEALSDEEIKFLTLNPYFVLDDYIELIPVASAGGGAAALAGDFAATAAAIGALSTSIDITAGAVQVATGAGTSTTSIAMLGAVALQASAGGDPTFTISLNGAVLQESLAQAAASTGIDLLGAIAGSAQMIGDLSGDTSVSGAATQQADGSGEITVIIALNGAPIAQALAAANLSAGGGLEGDAQQQSGMTGGVLTSIAIAGTPQAYASGSGNLGTILQISGAMLQVNSATGTLTAAITVRVDALQQALMVGDLTVRIAAAGAALQQAVMSGALNGVAGYVTPAARTLIVPKQNRTIVVPFQNRRVAA